MAGEYFIGQRPPTSQLAKDTVEVVPDNVKVTVAEIEAMDSHTYDLFRRRPGAEAAIDYAYEHRFDPPAPEPVPEIPPTQTE